jgi:hypothetical protein
VLKADVLFIFVDYFLKALLRFERQQQGAKAVVP